MTKLKKIEIEKKYISIIQFEDEDYICLTDMAKTKKGNHRAADIIKNWIRTRTTIEFLGTWEKLYNPNFKVVEFDHFKSEAGLPTFILINKINEKNNHIHIRQRFQYGSNFERIKKWYS